MQELEQQISELYKPSAETKKLLDSVNEYRDFQKKLNERLNKKPGEPGYSDFGSVIGANDMFKMKAMLKKLDEQALKCCDAEDLGKDESSFVMGVTNFTSRMAHMPRDRRRRAGDRSRRRAPGHGILQPQEGEGIRGQSAAGGRPADRVAGF
ncbi:MAG: hypothetical protein IJM17_02375 [Firmicutes bacterium]|nr:hypothetical protein [Bacillota bacterium]